MIGPDRRVQAILPPVDSPVSIITTTLVGGLIGFGWAFHYSGLNRELRRFETELVIGTGSTLILVFGGIATWAGEKLLNDDTPGGSGWLWLLLADSLVGVLALAVLVARANAHRGSL